MFSNITNQFTNLVGAVKGGQGEEGEAASQVETAPAPTQHEVPIVPDAGVEAGLEGDDAAKRKFSLVDSFIKETTGWLGSAKGWLGSASIPSMPAMPSMPSIPSMPAMPSMPSMPSIPGLRKGNEEMGAADETIAASENLPPVATGGATNLGVDDEDKSRYISATEGADSHPASGGGTPTNDEGQIGQGKGEEVKITTKVTQQAKHFGSFLTSAISKAGTRIKETVKENPILESFNKEQEAFIKGQGGNGGQGVAPWVGHANEAKIKEEILGLSQDRRNFVRAPPAGVDFDFNYDTAYPTAVSIMAEDKALENMRFELVPKIITEENFWRNYFYRVSLIIQAAELGTLGEDGVAQASSGEDALETVTETKSLAKIMSASKVEEIVSKSPHSNAQVIESIESNSKHYSDSEFVSDAFQSSNDNENDLEEIKDGMRLLGIDSMTQVRQAQLSTPQQTILSNDEEQWEKDLEAELKEYEFVDDVSKRSAAISKTTPKKINTNMEEEDEELPTLSNLRTRSTNNDWEEYADLIEDTDDLK
uniref:BSD domain-containing protein n=1 Tax=Glossina brevipalpis TaxID=37001 RepID=A0A1A9WJI3_9MUSC